MVTLFKTGQLGLFTRIVPPKASRKMLSSSSLFARLSSFPPKAVCRQSSLMKMTPMCLSFSEWAKWIWIWVAFTKWYVFQACPSGSGCETTVYSRIPWGIVYKCRFLNPTLDWARLAGNPGICISKQTSQMILSLLGSVELMRAYSSPGGWGCWFGLGAS